MFRQKERLVTADSNTSKGFTLFCRQTEEEHIWFIVASLRVRQRKINMATDKKVPTQHSFQGNSRKKNINAEKLPLFRDSDFSSPPLPHNSSWLEVETKSLINTIKTSNKQKKIYLCFSFDCMWFDKGLHTAADAPQQPAPSSASMKVQSSPNLLPREP